MADTVGWLVEGNIKPGKFEAFDELMQEMVEGTSAEPGTLNYEWYVAEDKSAFTIWEKYADNDATLSHVNGFIEKWSGQFMECCDMTRFVVYGPADDRVKETVGGWGPIYQGHWGGFARG
jgi:quinol monooxygenase YgiN